MVRVRSTGCLFLARRTRRRKRTTTMTTTKCPRLVDRTGSKHIEGGQSGRADIQWITRYSPYVPLSSDAGGRLLFLRSDDDRDICKWRQRAIAIPVSLLFIRKTSGSSGRSCYVARILHPGVKNSFPLLRVPLLRNLNRNLWNVWKKRALINFFIYADNLHTRLNEKLRVAELNSSLNYTQSFFSSFI